MAACSYTCLWWAYVCTYVAIQVSMSGFVNYMCHRIVICPTCHNFNRSFNLRTSHQLVEEHIPTLRHKGAKASEKIENESILYTYVRTHFALNSMVLYTSCAHFMQVVRLEGDAADATVIPIGFDLNPGSYPSRTAVSHSGFYSLLHIIHCTQSRDYSIGMVESHTAYGNGIHVSLQRSNTEITWLIAVCTVLSQLRTYSVCRPPETTQTLIILPWTLGYGMNWLLALL